MNALRGWWPRLAALAFALAVTWAGCGDDPPTRLRSCRIAESSLDFGPIYVGESATRDFLVINDGTAELSLTAVVASAEFHLTAGDTVRFVANPGDTARVEVTFAPTSLGSKAASLVLTGGPCDGASLMGEGANPCLVEPEALDFGIVSLNTPETQTLTITNLGSNSLEGSVSLDCSEFTIAEGAGSFSLTHGKSREVVVELIAAELGAKSCAVDLGMPLCPQVQCSAQAGRTWEVKLDGSGDAPTVQAAIDSAASGETVMVYPGCYYESIDYQGKDIVVRGESGPEVTILDGSTALGSVVVFKSGEGRRAVLEGFTIKGGRAVSGIKWGGGILIEEAEPVVQGNVVVSNYAGAFGGGIMATGVGWNPVIRQNTIRNNSARLNGGGIGVRAGVVEANWISRNGTEEGDGGGIWIHTPNSEFPVNVSVRRNTLTMNVAEDHGGGLYAGPLGDSQVEIAGNVIVNNTARGSAQLDFSGGGIWLYGIGASFSWVHHNTIVGNRAEGMLFDPTWGGGGIAILGEGEKLIESNIIAFSAYGGGIQCATDAVFTLRNNLAWENVGGDGNGACEDWIKTDGNLGADPLFCDREGGDLRLAENSPALLHDAGPLGAYPIAGCTEPTAPSSTWDRMRGLYR